MGTGRAKIAIRMKLFRAGLRGWMWAQDGIAKSTPDNQLEMARRYLKNI
jgi:hypothetical protein